MRADRVWESWSKRGDRVWESWSKRGDRNLVHTFIKLSTFSKIRERVSESGQENSSFSTFVKIGMRADRKTVELVLLLRLQ